MATGATKEVEDVTDLLEASMTTTAEANKAVVTSLNTVAVLEREGTTPTHDAVALAKGNSANFSISEKLFLAAEAAFHVANKIIFNPNYLKCFPGDSTDARSDEYQQEILLLIDNPSDTEEKFGKQVDKRILVNKRKLETVRLKLAKAINSACSANKMEKEKYAPFPLDTVPGLPHTEGVDCGDQRMDHQARCAREVPGDCARHCVLLQCIRRQRRSIWQVRTWDAGPSYVVGDPEAPDPAGYLRAERSETLYNEIEALGVTYSKASAASKKGVKTGLDGKTSILPIKGDGIRRVHLLLLSLGCTRSKDLRETRDMLRLLQQVVVEGATMSWTPPPQSF